MATRKLDTAMWASLAMMAVAMSVFVETVSAAPASRSRQHADSPPSPKWDKPPDEDQEDPDEPMERALPSRTAHDIPQHRSEDAYVEEARDEDVPPSPTWNVAPVEIEPEDPDELLLYEKSNREKAGKPQTTSHALDDNEKQEESHQRNYGKQAAPKEANGMGGPLNSARAESGNAGSSSSILPAVPGVPGMPGGSQSSSSNTGGSSSSLPSGFPSIPGMEGAAGDGRSPTLILGGFSVLVMPMPAGAQWASAMQGLIPGMQQLPGMPGSGSGGGSPAAPGVPGMPAAPALPTG